MGGGVGLRMNRRLTSCAAGFTLIELMVVMMMVTIILAVAIPRFDGGVFQDPTKAVARRMINTVRSLRSKAVQHQQLQSLVVDLDSQRFWMANIAMDEQAIAAAEEKAYTLPETVRFMEILFRNRDPVTAGKTTIHFYPAGYSDHAVIHLLNDDRDRFSFVVEPLLSKVKFLEEWIDL